MPAARRRADHLPVGRAITRPAKARGIDERFQPINRMRVEPLPVLRNKLAMRPRMCEAKCSTCTHGRIRKRVL